MLFNASVKREILLKNFSTTGRGANNKSNWFRLSKEEKLIVVEQFLGLIDLPAQYKSVKKKLINLYLRRRCEPTKFYVGFDLTVSYERIAGIPVQSEDFRVTIKALRTARELRLRAGQTLNAFNNKTRCILDMKSLLTQAFK